MIPTSFMFTEVMLDIPADLIIRDKDPAWPIELLLRCFRQYYKDYGFNQLPELISVIIVGEEEKVTEAERRLRAYGAGIWPHINPGLERGRPNTEFLFYWHGHPIYRYLFKGHKQECESQIPFKSDILKSEDLE